jgi:hypothetical protein
MTREMMVASVVPRMLQRTVLSVMYCFWYPVVKPGRSAVG